MGKSKLHYNLIPFDCRYDAVVSYLIAWYSGGRVFDSRSRQIFVFKQIYICFWSGYNYVLIGLPIVPRRARKTVAPVRCYEHLIAIVTIFACELSTDNHEIRQTVNTVYVVYFLKPDNNKGRDSTPYVLKCTLVIFRTLFQQHRYIFYVDGTQQQVWST